MSVIDSFSQEQKIDLALTELPDFAVTNDISERDACQLLNMLRQVLTETPEGERVRTLRPHLLQAARKLTRQLKKLAEIRYAHPSQRKIILVAEVSTGLRTDRFFIGPVDGRGEVMSSINRRNPHSVLSEIGRCFTDLPNFALADYVSQVKVFLDANPS